LYVKRYLFVNGTPGTQVIIKEYASRLLTKRFAPFPTSVGVDSTFLAVQVTIRQIVSCCQLLSCTMFNNLSTINLKTSTLSRCKKITWP